MHGVDASSVSSLAISPVGLGIFLGIALPWIGALVLMLTSLVGMQLKEKSIKIIAMLGTIGGSAATLYACALTAWNPELGGKHELNLLWPSLHAGAIIDQRAIIFAALAALIALPVGHFAARYMHKDPGYLRFFAAYLVFLGALQLVYVADEFEFFLAAWEMVGISSVLLIGFFQHRNGPVRNSLRAFIIYRLCDVALIGAFLLVGTAIGRESFSALSHIPENFWLGLLFIIAASLKSAQLPVSSWLSRAMEGPTPSSAVFYGALAVHLGALLLLKTSGVWMGHLSLRLFIGSIGLATAIFGALVGRTRSDVKNTLAYASLTQLGLIFLELALDLPTLALLHASGHAVVRCLQLLRSPSALQDHMRLRLGVHPDYGSAAKRPLSLYRLALAGFHLEDLLDRYLVHPLLGLSRIFTRFDRLLATSFHTATLEHPSPGHTLQEVLPGAAQVLTIEKRQSVES